ncbi:hypothetical protein BDV06DRAFT_224368 [Aspergillus oleicola]
MRVPHSIADLLCVCGVVLTYPLIVALAWVFWAIDEVLEYVSPSSIAGRHHARPTKAPTALPRRRRALTIPLPRARTSRDVGQRTLCQQQSRFFKLPIELRDMIYREVLESPFKLHVWRTHKRLCSVRCEYGPSYPWGLDITYRYSVCCRPLLARDGSVQRRREGTDGPRQDQLLPLLCSCRRIYSESIALLYTRNKFVFDDNRTFKLFPTVIPSHRLGTIRFLYIRFYTFKDDQIDPKSEATWKQLCRTLTGMKRLESLCIALACHSRDMTANQPGYKLPVAVKRIKMADSTSPSYPASLDTLFSEPSLKDQYDPIHLEDGQIAPLLALPLAKTVFGHSDDETSLERVSCGDISYTQFVTEKTKAVISTPIEGLTPEQQKSQLLHIGLAALFAFLQTNVTGPPLEFKPADVIVPEGLRSNPATLRALRDKTIRDLSVDGEAAYKLTPCVELFAVAKAILVYADVLIQDGPLEARTARMRVNFLHQKMLSEVTGTLQDVIYNDLDIISKSVLDEQNSGQNKGKFLLERATVHIHHGFDGKARTDLEKAAAVRKFEFALTGRLGKRTKFQNRDISQLVILAKSAEDARSAEKTETTESSNGDAPAPKKLDLNDDTLLEAISFTKPEEKESQGKAVTVQQESELPPALASLDPGAQPLLDPVDSAILLSFAAAITNTRPEDGLTREETAPYATRVLDGGSSNWQVYTQGLLLRSRIEGYRSRTVERSVLQMQALVDQVLADTATSDTQTTETQQEPSTFLPRPEKDESASASDRLKHIWLLSFSTRWDLESELANRWVNLGGLRTALNIYERLQMWAEVALCYAATDKEDKARVTVRRQLYEPTGQDPDSENEQFDGPELSPLPADAPRLFCILGDIQSDPKMYDRAWDVSNCRYARAQRSLARHFLTLKPPALEKAAEAYQKSLHINRLNHGAWFALGCVQLELHRWDEAIESFTRTVQLEDTDAEAWSNLAAAILRTSQPTETDEAAEQEQAEAQAAEQPTDQQQLAEDEEPSTEPVKPSIDPYKRKREAIAALHRAAQLKNTDSRIWDNLLTVSASIPPPLTPYRDVIAALRKVIELLGPKQGEKAIDVPILGMLIDHLVTAYEYEDLLIEVPERDEGGHETGRTKKVVRSGTIPGSILSLLENAIIPLITHSAPLWLLVASVERFRGRPSAALEAHEKAWRATVASATQGAFQMGDEKRWIEVVRATERLVRGGYAKYGPLDKEGDEGGEGGETELVAKDWRFKARSAVRGILGKGKEFWEGSEGWEQLRELQGEVSGGG